MRALALTLIASFVSAGYSCHHYDHHHDDDFVDDVRVTVSGDPGTSFDAFFEDDRDAQSVSGQVPFDAFFEDQFGFFHAAADKTESGNAELCLELRASGRVRHVCTTEPFGRLSITISF